MAVPASPLPGNRPFGIPLVPLMSSCLTGYGMPGRSRPILSRRQLSRPCLGRLPYSTALSGKKNLDTKQYERVLPIVYQGTLRKSPVFHNSTFCAICKMRVISFQNLFLPHHSQILCHGFHDTCHKHCLFLRAVH